MTGETTVGVGSVGRCMSSGVFVEERGNGTSAGDGARLRVEGGGVEGGGGNI